MLVYAPDVRSGHGQWLKPLAEAVHAYFDEHRPVQKRHKAYR
jgi:hypothetical protein